MIELPGEIELIEEHILRLQGLANKLEDMQSAQRVWEAKAIVAIEAIQKDCSCSLAASVARPATLGAFKAGADIDGKGL